MRGSRRKFVMNTGHEQTEKQLRYVLLVLHYDGIYSSRTTYIEGVKSKRLTLQVTSFRVGTDAIQHRFNHK